MSIRVEYVEKFKNQIAVVCGRTQEGTILNAKHLEDPDIFPDMIDSGLLVIPENYLKIEQAIGKKLLKTIDSLTPLTPDIVEEFQITEKIEESKCMKYDKVMDNDLEESNNVSINKLISQRDEIVESLKQIQKIEYDIKQAKLLGSDMDAILESIKNQRWFFFKNKPEILMDRDTGILWPNLHYFKYNKNGTFYTYKEAKEIVSKLNISGFENWEIPTEESFNNIYFGCYDFPFEDLLQESLQWISKNKKKVSMFGTQLNEEDITGYLLPYNTLFTKDNYETNIKHDNKIYSEAEKLQFTLNIFINNQLQPIFDDEEITQLYKNIYIAKPALVKKLNELQQQIDKLQQGTVLSSTFNYNSLLLKYDMEAIDSSIIKYYEAVISVIDDLMGKLHYYEEVKGETICDFNVIGLKLSKKYDDNPNLTNEENKILKDRQVFLKKHFELGMNIVKTKLLRIKRQAENIEDRIDMINNSENIIKELAMLEKEERPSFKFIVENIASIVKNALLKIEFFETNKTFVSNIVNLWWEWSEDYKVFKTTLKDEFKNICEDDSIESEIYTIWYEDWQNKRLIIEKRFLPLIKYGLKGNLININDNNLTVIEKVIVLLYKYKKAIDKFYLEERKNIYQKFAFQTGGDLQEKFEVESELYKISSQFQKDLQDIIFDLDKEEERIFLLRWANDLIDIQIDEILDFVKDKELNKISKNVLVEFANLKRKNYENFMSDAKAYSEERANREKQYNSLIFKMRKELMK